MTRLTIQVPEDQNAFIDGKVSTGQFADSGAYLRMLIGGTMKAEKLAALEALLVERVEAVENGDASEITAADWKRLKDDLRRRHGKGKKHGKAQSRKAKAG